MNWFHAHYLIVGSLCSTEIEPVPDNPQHEQYVAGLVNNLITEIENKAAVVTDAEYFLTKLKLAEAAKMFRQRYRLVLCKFKLGIYFQFNVFFFNF